MYQKQKQNYLLSDKAYMLSSNSCFNNKIKINRNGLPRDFWTPTSRKHKPNLSLFVPPSPNHLNKAVYQKYQHNSREKSIKCCSSCELKRNVSRHDQEDNFDFKCAQMSYTFSKQIFQKKMNTLVEKANKNDVQSQVSIHQQKQRSNNDYAQWEWLQPGKGEINRLLQLRGEGWLLLLEQKRKNSCKLMLPSLEQKKSSSARMVMQQQFDLKRNID